MQKARRRVSAPTACGHTGSGSISTPSRGAFHRSLAVLCAIGLPGVFSLAGWAPLRTQARREAPGVVPVRGYHPLRPRLSSRVPVRRSAPHVRRPTTPGRPRPPRFGLLPVRSPLLGESIFLSPPAGTGMFRFPAFARIAAHSDTPGSSPVCGSPGSFAAYRVLHRLWKPRHPPCALISFLRASRASRAATALSLDRLQSTYRVSVLYLVSSSRCSLPLLLLSQHFNELAPVAAGAPPYA